MVGAGLLLLAGSIIAAPGPGQQDPDPGAGRLRRPLVIGHAGSGFFHLFNPLPPSSLRSIARALRQGADGVEVDVRLSQDSIPVLYHDHTLDSMTDGQGCVSQTTAAVLTRLPYRGGWPHDWLQHEHVITLEMLLAHLARRGEFPYLHLDLHEDDACSSADATRSRVLARRLQQLLTRYQVPAERLLILTTQVATLNYLHDLLPTVPLGLEMTGDFEKELDRLRHLPSVQAAVVHKDNISPERSARIHALGRAVVVFGGRSAKAVRRVVATSPDAYEVDNVRQLRAMLRRQL
ncbi:hypothetical protein GCM10022408_23800 [Hymenobacter fastidiosus]|uniref:GP-PDE domain-containing protein n=2 Tax=Hymenobacter fastidiosus TaxID=486264 RepID=A0ABP7SEM0_9BACT